MSKAFNESGQMLLMAILIAMVLLVSIPVMILVNQMGSHQQVSSLQANKAEATAISGITYAVQELTPLWTTALTGNFNGTDCNRGTLTSPSGMPFTLTCDQSGRPYEVHVVATARSSSVAISSRSVEAYLSQRTVGVKLSNKYTASAAMVLVNTPTGVSDNSLIVHWGPVLCLSGATQPPWTLYDPMNSTQTLSTGRIPGFPRKFSLGGITGNASIIGDPFFRVPNWITTAVTSDQKEFWAFATQLVGPHVSDAGYKAAALVTNPGPITSPHFKIGGGPCDPTPPGSGHFSAPTDIVFDSSFHPAAGSIIYVNGNAEMDSTAIDLSTGALIVTGNLVLNITNPGDGVDGMDLKVPPSAPLEYPFYGPTDPWPCKAEVGSTCTVGTTPDEASLFGANGRVHFRGFLWVQGTLTVNGNWNMAGVIVAGDPLSQAGGLIINGGSLTLAYDDLVNHNILTDTTELQSDVFKDIATH